MIRLIFSLSLLCTSLILRGDKAPYAVNALLDLRDASKPDLTVNFSTELVDRLVPENRNDRAFMTLQELQTLEHRLVDLLSNNVALRDTQGETFLWDATVSVPRVDEISTPDLMLVEGGKIEVRLTFHSQSTYPPAMLEWGVFADPYLSVEEKAAHRPSSKEALVTVQVSDAYRALLPFQQDHTQRVLPTGPSGQVPAPSTALNANWIRGGVLVLGVGVLLMRKVRHPGAYGLVVGLVYLSGIWVPLPEVTENDVEGLLWGVYQSFDFEDERLRYRQLEQVLDTEMIDAVFLEIEGALRDPVRGTTRMQVTNLTIHNLESARDGQWEVEWTVQGYVGHWGHLHRRKTRSRALMRVEPMDGNWKIKFFDVLEQKQEDDLR